MPAARYYIKSVSPKRQEEDYRTLEASDRPVLVSASGS